MPDHLPVEPVYEARPATSDRLRAIRTLIVGVVLMWLVLVGAWAANKALGVWAASQREQEVRTARLRLASVAELSSVFNTVNDAIEPAVVKIDVIRPPGQRGTYGVDTPEANSGSGVIVEIDESQHRPTGYIITNHHVVAGGRRITVTLADGRQLDARVLGTDPLSDLAVLSIQADHLIAAVWGDSDTLQKGDWVLAFGSPFGFVGSMTAGIVSALNRTQGDGIITRMNDEAYRNFIQVDAAVNPGNSGGPLVNVQGQIVGINSEIFTRTGDFSGIGFAIPSNQARRVFEDIRDRGRVTRGWLGVSVRSMATLPPSALPVAQWEAGRDGVLVTEVYRDTPASAAGLRRGDVITLIDGKPVDDQDGVRNQAAFARPGQTLTLEVWRAGESRDVSLVVGVQPEGVINFPGSLIPQSDARSFGMMLETPPPSTGMTGAIVNGVRENSLAWEAGIRPGDRILEIDGEPVPNAVVAGDVLATRSPVLGVDLRIQSGERQFNLTLRE